MVSYILNTDFKMIYVYVILILIYFTHNFINPIQDYLRKLFMHYRRMLILLILQWSQILDYLQSLMAMAVLNVRNSVNNFSKLNSENNLNFKQGRILGKLCRIRF